jgi:DNA polymerase-1
MKQIDAPENATKLLVDIRAVIYASYFWAKKNYDIEDRKEMESAILMRFFDKIKMAHRYAKTNRVIFCCDSAKSIRREIYPDYKGKRAKDEHFELYRDFFLKIQNEIVPNMGFMNVIEAEGLEADDVIASICIQETRLPVVVLSDDADLYQCIKSNVSIMSVTRSANEACLMYPAKFERIFGINHERWADVKSIAGCTTDNVPGIEGVGEKFAMKYLTGQMSNGIRKARIEREEGQAIIKFTDRLVRLPFDGNVIPFEWQPDEFNRKYIVKLIEEYSLLQMQTEFWDKFFGF